MIAIGGAIGTGLFLGQCARSSHGRPRRDSHLPHWGGHRSVLMRALAEMAVAHPTAGSFGVYAELYAQASGRLYRALHLLGGPMRRDRRRSYRHRHLLPVVVSSHAAVVLDSIFTIALLYVNARSVGSFGSFEYWFAMIKVVAIVAFIAWCGAHLWVVRHWFRKPHRARRLSSFRPARRVASDRLRDLQLSWAPRSSP